MTLSPAPGRTLDDDGLVIGATDTIFTYTGKRIQPLQPNPDHIDIEDIAHALSNQCRFTGHTKRFYSVAEHSVLVAQLVPVEFALEALLHDASEAYLSDIARPIKKAPGFTETYSKYEFALEVAVAQAFRLPPPPMSPEVKAADERQLGIEIHTLCSPAFVEAYGAIDPDYDRPRCWSPEVAAGYFIDDFNHYWALREAQKENL